MKKRRVTIQLVSFFFLFLTVTAPSHQPNNLANSLQRSSSSLSSTLPIGQSVFKIEVETDGIYELDYAQLQAAGMAVDAINPHTFEMNYRGKSVAYEFVGDTDNTFEPDEAVRFYGWTFDGSRYEEQFVTHNVFWLWANGTPTLIDSTSNLANDPLNAATHSWATITAAPENDFFSGWTDRWDSFPNDADAWYWDRLPQTGFGSSGDAFSYPITLTHPNKDGDTTATVEVEFMSRAKASIPNSIPYDVAISMNGAISTNTSWNGRQSINISHTLPIDQLIHGENWVTAVLTTTDILYLNRISVSYQQELQAVDDTLSFNSDSETVLLSGFDEGAANNFIVWDVTDRKRPLAIPIAPTHVGGTDSHTLHFGSNHSTNATFIATTVTNLETAVQISPYIPTTLHPATGANWIAISHVALLPATQQLAAHRATVSTIETHVVDIDHIINQYGYGLPLPSAIRDYLTDALTTWQTPPAYVVLFGDATINPRQLACQYSCNAVGWDANEPTQLVTDLRFVDAYQGLIPTDFPITLLTGDDLIPDVAIGRIPARNNAEAETIVDKIVQYEQNQSALENWSQAILFVADNDDAAGTFCEHNWLTGASIPPSFNQIHLCLPQNGTADDLTDLQSAMYTEINKTGTLLLNYRGHGSLQYWGGNGGKILSLATGNSEIGSWLNEKPTAIISADCLDGHFAWPGVPSISETLLRHNEGGTAVHWSSSGLGTDAEHTILHQAFYTALFQKSILPVGDAVQYAKEAYLATGQPISSLYSFILLGDPAMPLAWAAQETVYLPFINNP